MRGKTFRCAWIGQKKRVWEEAIEKICRLEKERGYITLWSVQKCKNFDPGKGWEGWKGKHPAPLPNSKKKGCPKRYTPEEDAQLLSLREGGTPCKEIAIILSRHISSIYRRIARLKEVEAKQDGRKERIATK